ncbi:carbohydate-binding domain-containing protein [Sphingobacterium sp. SRCM116780]|uniref:family 20 glycosylhydrolase n=1 Tax=Sphingobacterium sp. SRCM116780 TaxID=2907623 RepID=UPI001F2D1040|nr:family 20 glycosylhydrolase [Sphingobacterium sp. SRCM116780]UIR55643.1 carbohydate-binding domain-containing protein [Sphingobacterium sp. SRCM116780]
MNDPFYKKSIWLSTALGLLSINLFAQSPANIENKIAVKWEVPTGKNLRKNPTTKLVIKNTNNQKLALKDWSLWFNFIRGIDANSIDPRFKLSHRNGDLFQLEFVKNNLVLQPKDTIEINFTTKGGLINYTDGPIGLYVSYDDKGTYANIKNYEAQKNTFTPEERKTYLEQKYTNNELLSKGVQQDILPQPTQSQVDKNATFKLSNTALIFCDADFKREATFFAQFLKDQTGVQSQETQDKDAQVKIIKTSGLADEAYELTIDSKGITVKASTATGAFYGIQSLKSLLPATNWSKSNKTLNFPFAQVKDQPRYPYRGLMLDVARNFHSKAEVLRLLDVMAQYKLNKFHFHFIDDEGWRLEIPGLPELTEIGSVRSANFKNGNSLQPAYGSGAVPKEKQFLSAQDYIEILQYAQARHIEVIPEIETPGHARAAIKSMEARYHKFKQAGDLKAAEEYLLHDPNDVSVYNSAQNWNDNVLNPALPSTYHFISKVIDEVKAMHEKAGVPLTMIDLGGDETPAGVWEKSPKIAAFMKEQSITSVHDVWPYYINEINEICQSKGLIMSGWEEMGMKNSGKRMDVNPDLGDHKIQLNVWNNLIGGGQEDLAYRLANAGYKVVFTSAYNNYLDMTWDHNFAEPGHSWVGLVDINKAYSFAPENYFINLFKDNSGKDLPKDFAQTKVHLTEKGKSNFLGVKGGLWSEKISNDTRLEEMIFPRLLAIADRGWAPEQAWENGASFDVQTYQNSYAGFMQKLGNDELKKLDKVNKGYHYRVPAVGVKLENGKLFANTDYPGFKIYYTENNTEPTLKSKEFKAGIPFNNKSTYKFRVITENGDLGIVSTY